MRKRRLIGLRVIGLIGLIGLMGCSSSGDTLMQEPPAVNGNGDGAQEQPHAVGFSASFAEEGGAAASRTHGVTRAIGDGEYGLDVDAPNKELQASGFGVYCWYTGTTDFDPDFPAPNVHIKDYTETILMLNQRVEYKNGQWTYSPSKYWPLSNSEKLTFRAYAPYVSYQLQTDDHGMPMLPVVVTKDDYHNGTQHDPLWGTSKHGGTDDEETKYGTLYDNYTYPMSGDDLTADSHDGVINWYFHHGMSKLIFTCSVIQDPGCDKVTIKSIEVTPLYTQGLLSLSSDTERNTDKPFWDPESLDGDMTVTLSGATKEDDTWIPGDLAPIPEPDPTPEGFSPYPFVIKTSAEAATDPIALLSKGLLIIPRDFRSEALKVTITYTVDDDDENNALEAQGNIEQQFEGNTAYTLKMNLTPSTKGLEITLVQSAFTPWHDAGTGNHTVYNW